MTYTYSNSKHTHKRIYIFLVFCLLILSSCTNSEKKDDSRVPYLEVDGRYLYVEDIQSVIPEDASKEDSLAVAQSFIKKWIIDALQYKHANNNIANEEEIDKLVDDYRKSLVIHQYQQNLIQERLNEALSEERLKQYYDNNQNKFRLANSIIKGAYIQVALGAPKFSNVQAWMRNLNAKSLENIEKYSVQNAASYQYFGDNWVVFNELTKNMPIHVESTSEFLNSRKYIEVKDSTYYYILRVTDVKFKGEIEPYELAKEKIQSLIMHSERMLFIRNFQEKLYKDAVDDGDITYFTKEVVK